jgi:hypothetical protein
MRYDHAEPGQSTVPDGAPVWYQLRQPPTLQMVCSYFCRVSS